MSRRLFLAVALDDEVRHGLAAFLADEVGEGGLPGRPVRPESWHVTLRFLGWCDDQQRDRIVHHVAGAVDVAPFTMGFGRLGAFPTASRAAVLWMGIDRGVDELARLAAVAEAAAVGAGLTPEERPFHPHLTLARLRPAGDVADLVAAVARFPLTQPVTAVTLFRTHLGRGGAQYEPVDEMELA